MTWQVFDRFLSAPMDDTTFMFRAVDEAAGLGGAAQRYPRQYPPYPITLTRF